MDKAKTCIQRALVEKAQPIINLLRQKRLSVVTAESCTAGLIAAILSHARGAGECFHGGFVTYSKAHKSSALGVDAALLRTRGSVTAEVARQMAQGALERCAATVAVAVTGVLGPDPDEDHAPPGLVFVSASRSGFDTLVIERNFCAATPDEVRQLAVEEALKALLAIATLHDDGSIPQEVNTDAAAGSIRTHGR